MQIPNAPPLLDFAASDEGDAIRRTAGLLAHNPDVLDFNGFLDAVMDRQKINPPVLGQGVAMPHARTAWVREIVFVASRSAAPIPFGEDGVPVRLVFLFGVPPHRISQYLAAMASLVKRLRNPEVVHGLLAAGQADEFMKWLE